MKKISIFFVLLFIISITSNALAVPASPGIKEIPMPDGTTVKVRLIGDERVSWFETLDGYTITKNAAGYFEYARLDDNDRLTATGTKPGEQPLPQKKHIRPSKEVISGIVQASRFAPRRAVLASQVTGTEKVLVLLIEFTDVKHTTNHETTYFDSLYFGTEFGQLNHYLQENSYGALNITGEASPWLQSAQSMGYYGYETGNNMFFIQDLVIEAIDAADPDINFNDYDGDGDGYVDHLIIIHAGGDYATTAQPAQIWSHRGEIYDYATQDGAMVKGYVMNSEDSLMGVHAHEFMHDLGAYDLYDYDYDGNPVSWWCLMDTGAYGGAPEGSVPTQLCGYIKSDIDSDPTNGYVGWLTAETLSQSGDYSLTQLPDESGDRLYRVDIPGSGEYFLMENRQNTGYDVSVPDTGIVIYHVDESMPDGATDWTINDGSPASSFYRIIVEDPGDPDDVFIKDDAAYSSEDGQTVFDAASVPNSLSNLGRDSGIAISEISASAQVMTFTLDLSDGASNDPPVVSVSAMPTAGEAPLTVYFTGTADDEGLVVSYHYDFGDGETSIEQSPSHKYYDAGDYTVTFTATDNDGGNASAQIVITVTKEEVTSDSGSSSSGGCGTIFGNIKPPSNRQIAFDMLFLMLPAFFIISRRFIRKV